MSSLGKQKKEKSKTAVESQNGDPGPSIKKFFYVDMLEFSVEGESYRFWEMFRNTKILGHE